MQCCSFLCSNTLDFSSATFTFLHSYGLALQHATFNPQSEMVYIRALRQFAEMFPSGVKWGSVCTGSGIEVHVLDALTAYWKNVYEVEIISTHKYMCDNAGPVQKHLMSQFGAISNSGDQPMLFDEVSSLADLGRGEDLIAGEKSKKLPLDCQGFLGGFSCTSRSPKNSKASASVNCVQTVHAPQNNAPIRTPRK